MCRIFAWRQNTGGSTFKGKNKNYHVTFSFPGMSDIVAFYRRRVWFLEVKNEKGKQNENQERFQSICEENGIDYHVVRSPEQAMEALEAMSETDKALERLAAYHEQAAKDIDMLGPEQADKHSEWARIIRSMLPDKNAPRPIFRGKHS